MTKKNNIEESFLGESDEQVVKENLAVETDQSDEAVVKQATEIETAKVEFLKNPIAFNMSNEVGDVTIIPLAKAIELEEAEVVKILD